MPTELEIAEGALYGAPLHGSVGDTISYKPAGGSYGDIIGFVDYTDQARSFDGAQVIEQDILIEVAKDAVPAKPTGECRVQLLKHPGLIFKPVSVGTDKSGNCWTFELVKVNV